MTDGTTLCPHCATRFRIAEAQLNAHGGMVRCGYCRMAFDARTNYLPEHPSPQLDLLTDDGDIPEPPHPEPVEPNAEEFHASEITEQAEVVEIFSDETQASNYSGHEAAADIEASSQPESGETRLLIAAPTPEDVADFSEPAETLPEISDEPQDMSVALAVASEAAPQEHAELADATAPHDLCPDASPEPSLATDTDLLLADYLPQSAEQASEAPGTDQTSRAVWPWVTGSVILLILLMGQSVYFFRVSLAAHLPALKPALLSYCGLLGCDVPLPRNAELMSIESSSLNADADHENQVNLDALLRNRASYALAFPVLSLTLNDLQDKPLASRIFLPADYLPMDETETRGLSANHELSIQLHMDTADLRPVGYRLELYYPK